VTQGQPLRMEWTLLSLLPSSWGRWVEASLPSQDQPSSVGRQFTHLPPTTAFRMNPLSWTQFPRLQVAPVPLQGTWDLVSSGGKQPAQQW
jgi:hypothetical protein